MEYNVMDDELIKINQIKNLEYISFYDYTIPNIKDGLGRAIVAPALMIKADGKTLNYSIVDKYFREYVKKVISVYQREKDLPIEAAIPSLSKGIEIDDTSKTILENASFIEKNSITSFYNDKDSFEDSLIFQSDEIKSIMDIVRHAITVFSEFINVDIKFLDNYRGFRDNYVIDCERDGLFTYLLINYYKISDNSYRVSIGNIADACDPYIIEISFLNNKILIKGRYHDLIMTDEYELVKDGVSHLYKVEHDSKLVACDFNLLDEVEINYLNLVNLDLDNDLTWYHLPWSAYLGTNKKDEKADKDTTLSTTQIMYLDVNSDNFYKREFYTKKLSRIRKNNAGIFTITIDEIKKNTFGFRVGDNYIIETNFNSGFGDGEFETSYNNRYFYHLIPVTKLQDINNELLEPISKDDLRTKDDLSIIQSKKKGVK